MQKIKKHYYGFISTQNEVGQAEIERKKIHRYDPFILDPEQGFPKKLQKKLKKLENINMASSQAKTGTGEAENMEKKNSRSDPFQPNLEQRIPKRQQKN